MRTTLHRVGAACAAGLVAQAGCAAAPRGAPRDPSPVPAGTAADSARAPTETRAVAALDRRAIDLQRASRVEELLRGRFAGVSVLRTADGDYAVRIRGDHGLGGGDPLFVVDGMPIAGSAGRALAGIAPNDVARIEVLKDAAATAPYGVQGRHGVVLITTRRRD
jgi:TonB-dependent SusC/RagA subfamily outer membrane receptor